MKQIFPLTRNQLLSLFFLLVLSLSLFAGMVLVGKKQDIRPRAGASTVTLSLYPATENFALSEEKIFELKATFSGGSPSEKLDGFRTEISFSPQYLNIPPAKYIDTSASGFEKIFRVDGPTVANENGRIIIKLAAKEPNTGPATDKPITLARITFFGKAKTPSVQDITIGTSQVVNNQSAEIPVQAAGAKYTVGTQPPKEGIANFLLLTKEENISVGQALEVKAFLETHVATKVSGADFVLLYDKNRLKVENIIPSIASQDPGAVFTDAPIVTSGGDFDANFNFLRVALVAKKDKDKLPSGIIEMATITFKAMQEGTAAIKFPEDNKYLQVVGVK